MSNVRRKISLGLVMLLVVMAISVAFADDYNGKEIFNLTATLGGKTLKNGETVEISPDSSRTINITTNPKYVDNTLVIGYAWDGGEWNDATGSATRSFTIPNFATGTQHHVDMEAYIEHNKDLPEGSADRYVGNSNFVTVYFNFVDKVATNVEVNVKDGNTTLAHKSTVEKEPGTTLTATGSTNVGTIDKFQYIWDGNKNDVKTINGSTGTITIPNGEAGKTKTLEITAHSTDGVWSPSKTYYIKLKSTKPIDDELIIEDWMKENKDIEALAVSLRNDSDEYEKSNKNMYALKEEVVYYVDYKNGGKDINNEVKLVLELPLDFDVVDAFGGTVDKEKKTITWTWPDGLEKGQSGTKVVKIKYVALSKSSKKSETIYPVAKIYVSNSKTPKDTSAVINLIFKDEDTEIADEHYPYMIGDLMEDKSITPTFRPDESISRAEGALVLARIFGINYTGTQVAGNEFSDLKDTYLSAQQAIVASSKMGLISGFPDGTYRPNDKMTKAQFMRIIASYVEVRAEEDDVKGLEIKEDDMAIKVYKNPTNVYMTGSTSTTNHWAIPYVTLLVRINMTPVTSSHKDLGLDEEITRAEVAQLVNFFLFRAPAEEGKVQFSDVSKNHKLYRDILEATMPAHSYTLTHEGTEVRVDD
ncbi:MAG: S-layer homology domain-containing protein [Clostridia bacterium]|nr:S-layer homology domain-containing protein [Clostridia bacterium]